MAGEFLYNKIVATLGPASASPDGVGRLIEEGVRVFRINFSHGSFEDFDRMLAAVRQGSENVGISVGVLGDLCGPKIRLGQVERGLELNVGDAIAITRQPLTAPGPEALRQKLGVAAVFCTNTPAVIESPQIGHRLLIDDGSVRTIITARSGSPDDRTLICNVTAGGPVSTAKGINLPDTRLDVNALTEYDLKCAKWAIRNQLSFLALSFVQKVEDIRLLKTAMEPYLPAKALPPQIIAKIEKPQALNDLEAIVSETDGLMVARGDLGVEMELAQVPVAQRQIISLAHDYGKPVIVATQMLQSMIESPGPTRAEVSDVANAIFDGADAVMLSGETAVGKYPAAAVHMMNRIALIAVEYMQRSREDFARSYRPPKKLQESRYRTAALAHGVGAVVRDLDARLVVTWSQSGGSARYLSQNRMAVPIVGCSDDATALGRMCLMFGVMPQFMPRPESVEAFVHAIDRIILQKKWGRTGDRIVILAGEPIGVPRVVNTLRVHQLGEE